MLEFRKGNKSNILSAWNTIEPYEICWVPQYIHFYFFKETDHLLVTGKLKDYWKTESNR
jgi:hypothetical protein